MQPYDEIQIANMHPDAPEDSYISTLRGMLEDDDETPNLLTTQGIMSSRLRAASRYPVRYKLYKPGRRNQAILLDKNDIRRDSIHNCDIKNGVRR